MSENSFLNLKNPYYVHMELLKQAAIDNGMKLSKYDDEFYEINTHKFHLSVHESATIVNQRICNNKSLTKAFLEKVGISTPKWYFIEKDEVINYDKINRFFNDKKVVVKPNIGSGGDLVEPDLYVDSLYYLLVDNKKYKNHDLLVEQHIKGIDYRLFVLQDKIIAGASRIPAHVLGDDKNTLQNLVHEKNKIRSKNPYLIDKPIIFRNNNYDIHYIPKNGEIFYIDNVSNAAKGGDTINCTDFIHLNYQEIVDKISSVIKLPYYGVDIICKDISEDPFTNGYNIIEINAVPDIALHHFPVVGKPVDVATEIVTKLCLK